MRDGTFADRRRPRRRPQDGQHEEDGPEERLQPARRLILNRRLGCLDELAVGA